ncbi:50S ribosomal protein L35 [Mycobacteroides abscessus subsp. abscessus]|uniref:Large ribosomal subunit protein bL35 n=1 Tax=Dermabacter vaginalis TaxID=1630135 RepID=A0ABX6A4C6_9MICO|nr:MULTISPECIES: 50S ribosomal protein L35 [Dermabacter]MCG7444100.1 50S ribosomal protein L35 [Dermabacter vaginalis]QEU11469.1 50S ribosomal protein L35 [Dermabacter vaginalis]RUP85583.1 50S ribosomal protein L35 [Dermabacter sp. HSID17554]SHW88636.1 50S ribosomal protein L35 [Mycobacteroides abscessus subsp. abscessus]
MPKNKTHSGAKKRIRITGSGKLQRQRANAYHKAEAKTSRHQRRLAGVADVAKSDVKNLKRMLGR